MRVKVSVILRNKVTTICRISCVLILGMAILGVIDVYFSPSHFAYASTNPKNVIHAKANLVVAFGNLRKAVYQLAWSPDNSRLMTASGGSVDVWDAVGGKQLSSVDLFPQDKGLNNCYIHDISWTPDREHIAVAVARGFNHIGMISFDFGPCDGSAKVWDMQGKSQTLLQHGSDNVWSVAWSPDGQKLAIGNEYSRIVVWDSVTGKTLKFPHNPYAPEKLSWSPDGHLLAGAYGTSTIIWVAETGEKKHVLYNYTQNVSDMAWSPDGKLLAMAGEKEIEANDASTTNEVVTIWDATTGKSVHTFWQGGYAVAWSPDGHRLATLISGDGWHGRVKLFDTENGKTIGTWRICESYLYSLAWSSDGRRLATGSQDGLARILDITNQ